MSQFPWIRVHALKAALIAGLLAVSANLVVPSQRTLEIYSRPVAQRAQRSKHNMEGMIALVKSLPEEWRKGHLLGLWNPYGDQVARNQFSMVMGYHLLPMRVIAFGGDESRDGAWTSVDCIAAYASHSEGLNAFLTRRGMASAFVRYREQDGFAVWVRTGCKSLAATACPLSGVPDSPPWSRILLLLGGLLVPLPLGWFVLSRLPRGKDTPPWACALLGWGLGVALLILGISLAGMAGISLPTSVSVALAIPITATFLLRKKVGPDTGQTLVSLSFSGGGDAPKRGIIFYSVTAMALAWAVLVILNALSSQMFDITALGIWGFKAKAFALAGRIDFEMLKDPLCQYTQPRYPLGFPLLLSYGYLWMGAIDDWTIRLLPAALGIGTFFLLVHALRAQQVDYTWSVLLALLFCSATVFTEQSTFVEAETLLVLTSLAGYLFLIAYLRNASRTRLLVAVLFLAAASWVKQEGLVFAGIGLGLACVVKWRFASPNGKRSQPWEMLWAALLFGVLVFPWYAYAVWQRLPNADFALSQVLNRSLAANMNVLAEGFKSFGVLMFGSVSSISGLWIMGTLVTLFSWRRVLNRSTAIFLAGAATLIVIFFSSVYLFSTYDTGGRLDWHLQANERLILLPTALLICLLGQLLSPSRAGDEAVLKYSKTRIMSGSTQNHPPIGT